MWFWLIGLGCVHEPDVPWLAAARIYGSTDALPPLHSEKSYFFHPFELEHNAKAVLTHPRPEWWDWFPVFRRFSDKPLLDEALIESDALRLKQWFMDNGWLDAEISWTHRIHERSGGTIVDYTAKAGARYTVADTRLTGWPETQGPLFDLLDGQYWNKAAANAVADSLLYQVKSLGFAAAEVAFEFEPLDGGVGRIHYQITPHQKNTLGQIHIVGVEGRTEKRIRQMAEDTLVAGSRFRPEQIERVSHQLANTPAFSAVRLSVVTQPDTPEIDLRFELIEQDKWEFEPFAVFASETTLYELGGGFRWTRSHVGKRNASVKGTHQLGYRTFPFFRWPPSIVLNDHGIYSKHQGEFWTAIFPMRGLSLSTRASNELGAEIGYQQLSTHIEGGLRWSPRAPFILFGGVGYGHDLFFATAPQQAIFNDWFGPHKLDTQTEQIYGSLQMTGDWVDNTETPRQGFQWRFEAQVYGQIENIPYTRIYNDMRVLRSSGPWTFIQRAGAGQMWWHGESLDSLSLRFFLGGGQSVRGWGRRRLEAPGYTGTLMEPRLGGDAMFQTSTELRYALFPDWSILTFVDSGRVWNKVDQVELGQILPSAGLGIRAPTPVGMATASLAYQLIGDNELIAPPIRIFGHFVLSENF